MDRFVNLLVWIIVGVVIADMVANAAGTSAFFSGIGGLWSTGLNALLGRSSGGASTTSFGSTAQVPRPSGTTGVAVKQHKKKG